MSDGSTAATATTLVSADRLVMNDMYYGAGGNFRPHHVLSFQTEHHQLYDHRWYNPSWRHKGKSQQTNCHRCSLTSRVHHGVDYRHSTVRLAALCVQDVSRTLYADLFTAIATTYGAGDGSSTFNVPDLRGRVIAGLDDMGGGGSRLLTAANSGLPLINQAGGSAQHTLTESEMPAHTHMLLVRECR